MLTVEVRQYIFLMKTELVKFQLEQQFSKSFTYETNDNTLKIVTEILGQKDEQEYTYSIDGDVLTKTRNNESVTYTKQK